MKKILRIEKKPFFMRIGTIEEWWVWVKNEDDSVKRYSCWGGVSTPDKGKLLHDLKEKVSLDADMQTLVGTEI